MCLYFLQVIFKLKAIFFNVLFTSVAVINSFSAVLVM